jgi:hypothetical protein
MWPKPSRDIFVTISALKILGIHVQVKTTDPYGN